MKKARLQRLPKTKRTASALLGLLIIIGLVILVYFGQLWFKKMTPNPDIRNDLTPWKEWRLRQANPKPSQEPSDKHPKIAQQLECQGSAEAKDKQITPRGEITLLIAPDGKVAGMWGGNYYNDAKVNFEGGGDFAGYICPAKIYKEETGQEDPSRLYFIAKGKFQLHESDLQKTYYIRVGDLYVTGWLSPNYNVEGKVTLTSDEKYYETFYWKGYAKPSEGRLDFGGF